VRLSKKGIVVMALLLSLGAVLGFAGLAGADSSAGSDSDPLVTKSFVEQYVHSMLDQMKPAEPSGGSLGWSVATLQADQEFTGKAGAEFIVRGGQAVVVDPTGAGIPDLTAGTNVTVGQVAQNNHLFTIPRTDGRGIKAVKQTTIMYRGN